MVERSEEWLRMCRRNPFLKGIVDVDHYLRRGNSAFWQNELYGYKHHGKGYPELRNILAKMTKKDRSAWESIGQLCIDCERWPNKEKTRCGKKCVYECLKQHACDRPHLEGGPCPPCEVVCDVQLVCGHWRKMLCYTLPTDYEIMDSDCTEPCIRKRYNCRHPCEKICNDPCGPCPVPLQREHPKCGHIYDMKCGDKEFPICRRIEVSKVKAFCGHYPELECNVIHGVPQDRLHTICQEKCQTMLACGHPCEGRCADCKRGVLHVRCQQICNKTLFCGHTCSAPCHKVCPPCWETCERVCSHEKCSYPCGVPCKPCEQPCNAFCSHSKCTKGCGADCDRGPCNEPCSLKLPDGEPCMGICGEPCPPLSLAKNERHLIDGMLMLEFRVTSKDRFVYLPSCGHTIWLSFMDEWVGVKEECSNGEIIGKKCPLCRHPIGNHPRYQKRENAYWREIDQIKKMVFGRKNFDELSLEQFSILERFSIEEDTRIIFPTFRFHILSHLISDFDAPEDLIPMDRDRVQCVDFLSSIWEKAERDVKKANMYEPEDKAVIISTYEALFELIMNLSVPFTGQEYVDLNAELERVTDIIRLYSRRDPVGAKSTAPQTRYGETQEVFESTAAILTRLGRYDEDRKREHNELIDRLNELLRSKLNITEEEKKMILTGLDEGGVGGVGRWFKCPNGHLYVITECGGPTQQTFCPVENCGAEIGGIQHRIARGNFLASEMDGAERPLYPTVFKTSPDFF